MSDLLGFTSEGEPVLTKEIGQDWEGGGNQWCYCFEIYIEWENQYVKKQIVSFRDLILVKNIYW